MRPTATIVSIAPENPSEDSHLVLTGMGSDDGEITNYSWRSSIDGQSFNGSWEEARSRPLNQRYHIIYLKVQDDQGAWSDEGSVFLEVGGNLGMKGMMRLR